MKIKNGDFIEEDFRESNRNAGGGREISVRWINKIEEYLKERGERRIECCDKGMYEQRDKGEFFNGHPLKESSWREQDIRATNRHIIT